MSIIDKAKAHFISRVGGNLLSTEVPEWDCTIYFKPSISLKSQAPISKLLSEGKSEEALVQTLIIRALDESGKPAFRPADKVELMHRCDPDVISRVVREMNADDLTVEEAGND